MQVAVQERAPPRAVQQCPVGVHGGTQPVGQSGGQHVVRDERVECAQRLGQRVAPRRVPPLLEVALVRRRHVEEPEAGKREGMDDPQLPADLRENRVLADLDRPTLQLPHEQERQRQGAAVEVDRQDLGRRYALAPDPLTHPGLGRDPARVAGLEDVPAPGRVDEEVLVADEAGHRSHR